MQMVEGAGGVQLATYDFGGDGPDLLLAHATGFHAHVWLPVVEHLRDAFHCWAFDERGHGASSSPPDGNFDWHAFGQDALAVVDALGLERPVAAGHSCGGALLILAEEARPGTFASLWCFEPVIRPSVSPAPSPGNHLAEGARRRREVFESKQAAYDNFASKPPFASLAPDALRAYVEHGFVDQPDGTVTLACRRDDEAATYSMGANHHAFRDLGRVACPVHVTCGAQTDAFGPAMIRPVADAIPRGTSSVMDGLTHFGPLEDPAAVAASIRAALLGAGS